jgi:transcriptional regulator with XRE-family HTH domain
MASSFATLLRQWREGAGLTQEELANRSGLGARTVSNLERGVNTSPYPSTVRLLAEALGLGSDDQDTLLVAAPVAARPPRVCPDVDGSSR